MKTDTYFQQFKTNLFHGVKAGVVPALLINLLSVLLLSIGINETTSGPTSIEGEFLFLIISITPLMLIAFLGIVFISAIISANRKISNIAAFLIGGIIGIAIIAIGDCILLFTGSSYAFIFEFLSLPSITMIILLAYLGQKMNRQARSDSETKFLELELRASLWLALIATIGSLAFVLSHEEYGDMLDVYIRFLYRT